jgi:hypothetical protein
MKWTTKASVKARPSGRFIAHAQETALVRAKAEGINAALRFHDDRKCRCVLLIANTNAIELLEEARGDGSGEVASGVAENQGDLAGIGFNEQFGARNHRAARLIEDPARDGSPARRVERYVLADRDRRSLGRDSDQEDGAV